VSRARTGPAPADAKVAPVRLATPRRRRRPSGEAPPLPRQINTSGAWWLVLVLGVGALCAILAVFPGALTAVDIADHAVLNRLVEVRTAWLTRLMKVLGAPATGVALQLVWLVNLAILVIWRRWRHLLVWLGSGLLVITAAGAVTEVVQRPRPLGIEILGPWKGYAMPSLPLAVLATFLTCTLYALVPAGRLRERGKLIAALLIAQAAASRMYLGQDNPTDALSGVVLGVAVPLLAFRLLAPNDVFPVTYRRGRTAHLVIDERRRDAITRAFEEQLGFIVTEMKPFRLEGSGGSTPLRVRVKGDPDYVVFAKLYSQTHLRSDRWYKLGRTLLYGRLEDERAFNTVRRLVQYEDYVLRLLRDADLPVPRPYGIVEITPEREYLVVMEFFPDATEIGDAEIDDSIIDAGLLVVRRMWEVGLAHRDIKPANLLVQDGRLLLIDPAFAQLRPSPWRQAVDLANMMLVLALRTEPARVLDRARIQFTDNEIAEAFAATRGITMPSQLRRMVRAQGRDLHAEFVALLPQTLPRVKIQRWSLRRACLSVTVIVLFVLAVIAAVPLVFSSPL
jgi:tRNA A-37 threonylcarbamoyl transferase component Bud32